MFPVGFLDAENRQKIVGYIKLNLVQGRNRLLIPRTVLDFIKEFPKMVFPASSYSVNNIQIR